MSVGETQVKHISQMTVFKLNNHIANPFCSGFQWLPIQIRILIKYSDLSLFPTSSRLIFFLSFSIMAYYYAIKNYEQALDVIISVCSKDKV